MQKGNLFGVFAILLWSTLASLGVMADKIPPFQLNAMAFFVAFIIGSFLWKKQGKGIVIHLKWPLKVWLVGVIGLFGYHFFYFSGIQNAPAIEANLINYLWPLLIVLFSSFLPNEKLRWFHMVGVILGLIGVFFLVSKDGGFNFDLQYIEGYFYAFLAAITWGSYSVLSRLFGKVPTSAVGGFCGVTSVLSLFCHLLFETTVTVTFNELLVVIAIGLGPVGGAFYVWDYAVKHGDIQLLGTLAYAIPLLSTFLLVLLGLSEPSPIIWIACFFIVLGSLISSLEHFKKLYSRIAKKELS